MAVPHVTTTSVRRLRPNKRNARTHSKKQIRQIADSIQRFGWTYPILIDEGGNVIAGHGRFQAAEFLRLREVPTIVMTGLSETEKRALALADNKIAANAGWDRALLAAELGELAQLLPECKLDIEITGFEPAEIDALMGDLVDPEQDPADEVPELAPKPVSRTGDLWLLDRHRLLCADARARESYNVLLEGERADAVFTDPPYNVRIGGNVSGKGKIQHREFAMASGEMSEAEFVAFLKATLGPTAAVSRNGAVHFICIDWRHLSELQAAGREIYGGLLNLCVWAKTNGGMGSLYRSQHELVFVFRVGKEPHRNNVELGRHGRNRSNVWSYAGVNTFRAGRLEELAMHPTAKPVALVADAIRDVTSRGEIFLDPFMGSGTTILAAERVGRRGYGLEIDPLYVDAAIRRWQKFTKRDAVLKRTGQTFDELTDVRASGKARRPK